MKSYFCNILHHWVKEQLKCIYFKQENENNFLQQNVASAAFLVSCHASSRQAAFQLMVSWLISSQMPQLLIEMIQCKSMRFSRHKQLMFQQAAADEIAVSDCMAKRAGALVQKILCLESFQTFPFQLSEKFCFQINFEMFRVSVCQSFFDIVFLVWKNQRWIMVFSTLWQTLGDKLLLQTLLWFCNCPNVYNCILG